MGGDRAPHIVIDGAVLALQKFPQLKFIVYGDESVIKPLLAPHAAYAPRIDLRHTPDRVLPEDKPAVALRQGRQSSMRLAIDCVANGEAQAVVSAGNTGALMALAKFSLKVMPGIDRPAIATFLPSRGDNRGTVMLDLGANAECTPENLLQFAVLGGVFSREAFKIAQPRIGLLNIGSEAMKGNELVQKSAELLAAARLPGHYSGFAEGDDISSGNFDVIVTDGFTGNVTLKAIEGTAKLIKHMIKEIFKNSWLAKLGALVSLPGILLALPSIKSTSKRMDPRYYNGASLLGLRGLCIKSHGSTDGIGFANAISVAVELAQNNFVATVEAEIKAMGLEQAVHRMQTQHAEGAA